MGACGNKNRYTEGNAVSDDAVRLPQPLSLHTAETSNPPSFPLHHSAPIQIPTPASFFRPGGQVGPLRHPFASSFQRPERSPEPREEGHTAPRQEGHTAPRQEGHAAPRQEGHPALRQDRLPPLGPSTRGVRVPSRDPSPTTGQKRRANSESVREIEKCP